MILYPAALFALAAVTARSVGSIAGTLLGRRQAALSDAMRRHPAGSALTESTPIHDALVAEREAFEREATASIEAIVNEWRWSS